MGWDNRLPVTWPCRVSEAAARELDTGEARLTTTLQNALDAGVEPQGYVPFSPATPVLLVSLPTPSKEDPKAKVYLLGSVNFAALLDYNRSFFYAQSVTELAAALTAAKTTAA